MLEDYMLHCRNALQIFGPMLFDMVASAGNFHRWLRVQKARTDCNVVEGPVILYCKTVSQKTGLYTHTPKKHPTPSNRRRRLKALFPLGQRPIPSGPNRRQES